MPSLAWLVHPMRDLIWCLTLFAAYTLGQPPACAQGEPTLEETQPAAAHVPSEPVLPDPMRAPASATWRTERPLPRNAEPEPFDPGRGVPPGYHLEKGVRKWLVISGGALFGASYGMSLIKAMAVGGSGDDRGVLLLPLAGPFIYLAGNLHDTGERLAWAVVGTGQLVGAAAFILGLTMKVTWIVPDEQDAVYVGPMQIGRNGYGGGLSFCF